MPSIVKSKTEQEKKDLELVKQIKPHLRKFLINEQQKAAESSAKEQRQEQDLLLGKEDVIRRASQLAAKAMLQDRIWEKFPSYFEMKWTRTASTNAELERERNTDVAGFAVYLAREYNNFLKHQTLKRGYLNPMNETHIMFFWQKMQSDLALLIKTDQLRVAKGNKSLLSEKRTASGIILPK